jgi:predicted nucleotidyltransferase
MHSLHLLLQRIADVGLEFVIIGGYAGVLHGSALVTNDVDVCAVLTPANIDKLRAALADLHPVHRITSRKLSFLDHPVAGAPLANASLETDGGIIDILSNVAGVGDYARLRERAATVTLLGRTYHVISLEDLIAAKEAIGREKDLLAVKELRAIAAKRRDTGGEKIQER